MKPPPYRNVWDDFCKNPEEENFQPLFEATKGLVYTICFRILRDRDDAQDAFQSTYCRLLAVAEDRARTSNLDDWEDLVCRLAVRESDNLRKRLKRHRRREIAMEKLPLAPDSHPRADQVVERRQLRTQIERIISALPERYRVPVLCTTFTV